MLVIFIKILIVFVAGFRLGRMASLLRPSGDYRSLLSYRKAEQIYDLTYYFCKAYLSSRDRTVDQMVQAARSGKQNIAEGKEAGLVSMETEIKLMNVARASLDELLADYEDFLRVRGFPVREKDSRESLLSERRVRINILARDYFWNWPGQGRRRWWQYAICLIFQAKYLLCRHSGFGGKFLEKGDEGRMSRGEGR